MRRSLENGDPLLDTDGFRRSLGEFATGVTVITTAVDGVQYGVTSNSFASVSLKPPLVLWSIRRESQSFAAFQSCTHFAVNVLAYDQVALSQRFAKSGPNKFDGIAWASGAGRAPLLSDVAAIFECRLIQTVDGGDHVILIGQVEGYSRCDRQPLLFSKGRYAVAVDHPDVRSLANTKSELSLPEIDNRLLTSLLVRAYGAIASQLEKSRQAAGLGLTLMQARLLKAAQSNPNSTLEELQPELLLHFDASQDVLKTVVELGLLVVDGAQRLQLTQAGENLIDSIVDHTRMNEAVLFRDISQDDLRTTQRVLCQIIGGQR